jgi:hypothetical protein
VAELRAELGAKLGVVLGAVLGCRGGARGELPCEVIRGEESEAGELLGLGLEYGEGYRVKVRARLGLKSPKRASRRAPCYGLGLCPWSVASAASLSLVAPCRPWRPCPTCEAGRRQNESWAGEMDAADRNMTLLLLLLLLLTTTTTTTTTNYYYYYY